MKNIKIANQLDSLLQNADSIKDQLKALQNQEKKSKLALKKLVEGKSLAKYSQEVDKKIKESEELVRSNGDKASDILDQAKKEALEIKEKSSKEVRKLKEGLQKLEVETKAAAKAIASANKEFHKLRLEKESLAKLKEEAEALKNLYNEKLAKLKLNLEQL